MTGKLIIQEWLLDALLDDLYELRGQLEHDKEFTDKLNIRIHRVEAMLKNIKPYELICEKCKLREGGSQATPNF